MVFLVSAFRERFSAPVPKFPIAESMTTTHGDYTHYVKLLKSRYNRGGKDLVELALDKLSANASWNKTISQLNTLAPNQAQHSRSGNISKEALGTLEAEVQNQMRLHFPPKNSQFSKSILVIGGVFIIVISKYCLFNGSK